MRDHSYDDPFSSHENFTQYEYRVALDCILPHLLKWGIEIKGEKVLDLGCGAGGLTVALAEKGARCFGVDSNPSLIAQASRLASERLVRAEFVTADVLKVGELDSV